MGGFFFVEMVMFVCFFVVLFYVFELWVWGMRLWGWEGGGGIWIMWNLREVNFFLAIRVDNFERVDMISSQNVAMQISSMNIFCIHLRTHARTSIPFSLTHKPPTPHPPSTPFPEPPPPTPGP